MHYLDTFSRFAAELDIATVPAPVREQLGWILADTLAAIVGGSAEPEVRALAASQPAAGPATLPGLGRSGSADMAAGTHRPERSASTRRICPAVRGFWQRRPCGRFLAALL